MALFWQKYYILLALAFNLLLLQFIYVKTVGAVLDDPIRNPKQLRSTVTIALLIRNKAHVLPIFLKYVELLNYPKQRTILW